MKVVLFCGGLGLRLRDRSDSLPKPMVNIGYRPILWHVMKYYAYYGHKDFILCLGYKGNCIKEYFLNYDECISNNFTLSNGGKRVDLDSCDIEDWKITFVDTGLNSLIGERLKIIEPYLEEEEVFLANYSDNLTNFYLPELINRFMIEDKVAAFLCVKPSQSFHVVNTNGNCDVVDIKQANEANIWLNGGYFVLRRDIFRYMNQGDELVEQPFQRLIRENNLMAYKHNGFWACMDTFKEKQQLEDMYSQGNAVWKVWSPSNSFEQNPDQDSNLQTLKEQVHA